MKREKVIFHTRRILNKKYVSRSACSNNPTDEYFAYICTHTYVSI